MAGKGWDVRPEIVWFPASLEMQIFWPVPELNLGQLQKTVGSWWVCSRKHCCAPGWPWHWDTPTGQHPLPCHPLGAEHSHSACASPELCPLMSCGSAFHLCYGLGREGGQAAYLGPEMEGGGGL